MLETILNLICGILTWEVVTGESSNGSDDTMIAYYRRQEAHYKAEAARIRANMNR